MHGDIDGATASLRSCIHRELEIDRDHIEAFGNTAASVNNYGRVLSQCESVDDTMFVHIALALETSFAEADIQLMELLAADGGTAIDGILAEDTQTRPSPETE